MKITLIRTNKRNRLIVSTKTMDRLMERIKKDDARLTVSRFREAVPYLEGKYQNYNDMPTWTRVFPAAEFAKDDNGNLTAQSFHGLLLLRFGGGAEAVEKVKRCVSQHPSTLAAFVAADGESVNILVRYGDEAGKQPEALAEAENLYQAAYRQISTVYRVMADAVLLPSDTNASQPSLRDSFLMTLDPKPYYNPDAVAMRIDPNLRKAEAEPLPEERTDESEEEDEGKGIRMNILNMINLLRGRYDFRYNAVMKYVEYMPKDKRWTGFMPLEPRVQKRMTLEVQLADIRVSIKDVRNFIESDYIPEYNPVEQYLSRCSGKWDGEDHIRALARTVPTDNPYWQDWFYTWFLATVDQWRGGSNRQYGNSVAPLLISRQGYNKSTFCRRLLPPELQWGYNDNLVLSEKRQVYQAMSQFMVINLDEFNQITPQVQQGFLKNLIQLPTVKIKRPYGSHVEEFPRMASFIATSNMTDILSDPSGNRRFIGVELSGPIDVSVRPNHVQLFAQALAALREGEKSYFDDAQVKLIMQSNRRFEVLLPAEQYFRLHFDIPAEESEGEYLTAAEIFDYLKQRIGSSLKVSSLMTFGRRLANIPSLKRKRNSSGTVYLVRKKPLVTPEK